MYPGLVILDYNNSLFLIAHRHSYCLLFLMLHKIIKISEFFQHFWEFEICNNLISNANFFFKNQAFCDFHTGKVSATSLFIILHKLIWEFIFNKKMNRFSCRQLPVFSWPFLFWPFKDLEVKISICHKPISSSKWLGNIMRVLKNPFWTLS